MPRRISKPLPPLAGVSSRRKRDRLRQRQNVLGRHALAVEALEARHLLTTVGDFTGDDLVNVADVDALAAEIRQGPSADLAFDLTGDGLVDLADLGNLIESVLATHFGDANLDGTVDRRDAAILAGNLGRAGFPSWSQGNFDANDRVDLADAATLQMRLGATGPSDPVLVNTTTVINQSLPTIETALFDWAALFDLTLPAVPGPAGPGPAGSGPVAGNLSENVPIVDDNFFATLGVSAALGDAVPEVEITGNDLELRARLADAGYTIDLFPGGPEGGPDNDVLQVRYAGRVEGLVGQTPFDAATIDLLHDLNPAATLDGTIDYGTVDHPAAIALELVFGVDDEGFYLLGESQIALEVGAEGQLAGSFPLPIDGLDAVLSAQATADVVVSLAQSDPARRLRTADLSAPADTIWNVSVDANTEIALTTALTNDGQPTPFSVGSSWQMPMSDGVLGPVTSAFDTPDAGAFLDALFPTLEQGLRSFLSPEIAALVDDVPLPFGDDGGPLPPDGDPPSQGQPVGGLAQIFDQVVSGFDASFDDGGLGAGDGLDFDLDHAVSAESIQDLLRGQPLGEDLARVSITLDAGDDFEPVAVRFGLDLSDVGSLEQFGLVGAIAAEVAPNLSLSFGVDADGFFLDAASTAGGLVSGVVDASAAALGPFGVEVHGELTSAPSIAFADLGSGRLRVDDLGNAIGQLQVSLGAVTAELDVALVSHFLDYVPVDAIVENNSPRGGDPFRFVAHTSLAAASTAGGISYTFAGIDLLNPDVDEDGTPDFTMPVLVDNLIQFGRDQIVSPSGVFGQGGILAGALGGETLPLSSNSVDDKIDIDQAQPDFDAGNLQGVVDLVDWLADNYELLRVVEFDTIENWLANGFPAQSEELLRLRLDLDGVELTFVEDLQAELGSLLPGGFDPTSIVRVEDVELSGQLVFGVDTGGGFYLVVGDEAGNVEHETTVGVSLDIVGDLSGLTLSNDIFSIDDGGIFVTPEFRLTLAGGDGQKLRLADLLAGNIVPSIQLVDAEIGIAAVEARLFPRPTTDGFSASVEGLRGTIDLSGAFNVSAARVGFGVGDVIDFVANDVGLSFDPAAPTAALAQLSNVKVDFPGYPGLPIGTIDQITIEPDRIDIVGAAITFDNVAFSPAANDGPAASPAASGSPATVLSEVPGRFDYRLMSLADLELESMLRPPSINNRGEIGIVGDAAGINVRDSIYLVDPTGEVNDALPDTLGPTTSFDHPGQVNDNGRALVYIDGLFDDALLLTPVAGSVSQTIATTAIPGIDEIYPLATVNNHDHAAYVKRSGSQWTLERSDFGTIDVVTLPAEPILADDGTILMRSGAAANAPLRLYPSDGSAFAVVADATDFDRIGQRPGYSDDGRVIVFHGELNAAGASRLNTVEGAGLFAAVRKAGGGFELQRIVGTIGDGSDDPGRESVLSLDADSRIAVSQLGTGTKDYLLAFTATTPSGVEGLFAARLRQMADTDTYTAAEPAVVAAVGGTLGNGGPTVTAFELGDGISANGQIVFWADTSAGEQVVTAQEPRRPIFVVPGIAGTYAADLSNDLAWLMNRGAPPDQLQIDPIIHAYDDLILSLQRAGYVMDRDLFVANYDWRLNPGPLDGASADGSDYDESKIDGRIDGLTTGDLPSGSTLASITDDVYEYGVDYLGHFLRKATESWAARHPSLPLSKVDVVAHSTGGLVTRTYIQSDAYGGSFHSDALGRDLELPEVGRFFSLAVPHRGASKAWNPLHDNFGIDVDFKLFLSKMFHRVALELKRGGVVTGPDPFTINDVDLETQAGREAFISRYVPTIRGLLATYPFLNVDGQPGFADVNDEADQFVRNNLALDLNNGLDFITGESRDHNPFLDKIEALHAIAGIDQNTPKYVVQYTGNPIGAEDVIAPFDEFESNDPQPGQVWYDDHLLAGAGDGTVPTISSVGQFLQDPRKDKVRIHQYTTRADVATGGSSSHTGLTLHVDVQAMILQQIGFPVQASFLSTELGDLDAWVVGGFLGRTISERDATFESGLPRQAVVVDPVYAVLTDTEGNRFGFHPTEGVLTEIPGSIYIGGTDGVGYLPGDIKGPLTVDLTSVAGQDYFVQLSSSVPRAGGLALSGNQDQSTTFDFAEFFRGLGIRDVLEVGDLSITANITVAINPGGIGVTGDIGLSAAHAALFPDTSTRTDPSDVAGTLDGLVTTTGFSGNIDLATGALHLEAQTAGIDVDGIVSATAVGIEDPPGSGTLLPAIEFDFDPTNTDPAATIGALRGLTVDFAALGDDVPSDLIAINQAILRRNGFSLDGSIGDPAAVISFGDGDPVVQLTGLVGTADIDVAFTPAFSVTGTVAIQATQAEFLPGSEINGALVGAELIVDLATGDTTVTVDELRFEVGDLFTVSAASQSGQPAIELDLTSVLTDPTATIVTIPSATISTGLFTDASGQPISFALTDLVVRGDGVSLGSAALTPTDLFLSIGGVDVLEVGGLSASISNLSFDRANGFGASGLTLSVAEAALLPDRATSEFDGVATLSGLDIALDLATGELLVTATDLSATLGDFIEVSVQASGNDLIELAITSDPTERMLYLPLVEAAFIGLADVAGIPRDQSPKLQITDLEFFADGNWQVDTVGLVDAADFAFGVADFLPFALDSAVLSNFGQTPGGGVDFNQFTLDMTAKVNWMSPLLADLPFDPFVVVGGVRVDEQTDNALPLAIVVDSLREGKLRFVDTGPITLGFENWDVGGIVFEGELTFGQYNGMGALEPITPGGPQLAGYIGFNTAASDVESFDAGEANFDRFEGTSSPEDAASQHPIDDANSGGDLLDVSVSGGQIAIAGAVTNDGTTLSAEFTVDAGIDLRFKLAEIFELYGVSFDFTFVVATPVATFDPTFEITSATLAVDALRLSFGGSDPDKSLELTALGYTTSTGDYIPAVRINVVPEDDEPLAEFGTLGVHFPDIFIVGADGTDRIGGRISGLRLLQGFIPDVRDDLEIVGDFGDFFSPENEIFSWLPFRVDSLGVRFQDSFFERDPGTMAITGIDDPLAFDLAFSGGFVDVELVDGVRFPIEATFDNLEIDVAKLKRFVTDENVIPDLTNFPIKNLDGISIGLDPFSFFEDSPITFRGKLSLGEINQDGIRAIYGRVLGEFAYSDWGGGIDLIISDRGPLLAKINVPMAIVLGQTTLTISGVSGGIAFGVGNLRSVDDPLDLVRDPVFIDPFDVSTDGIKDALRGILDKEAELGHPVFTWSESFTIGLSGSITSVAVAGAISGEVTLVANVEWPDVQIGPNGEINQPVTEFIPDLRLFGTGNIAILGMPIGRAGLLLDYSDPLSPSLAFGFAAPAPGSPLGFLIPAQAELGALLTTDGFYEAPIVALSSFVTSMAGSTLDAIAARLEADHSRPLSTLLLDLDGDGELSAAEDAQVITSSFILDRLLVGVDDPQNVGQMAPPILPTSFGDVANFDIALASRVTNAFTTEYFNVVGDVAGMAEAIRCENLSTVPAECVGVPSVASYFAAGQQAVADFAQAIAAAAFEAGLDAWEGFDPRLTISGRIQPTLLGFPIGQPLVDGTIVVDKSGLTVDLSARLTKILQLLVNQSTGGIGGTLLELLSLGMEDYTQLGFRLKFPEEELTTIVRGLLTGGATILDPSDPSGNTELVPATDLAQAMLNLVNPFAGWEALVASEFTIAGFRVGNVSGVMFDKLDADQFDEATGEPLPDATTLAGSRIYNLDADRDGEPDPARVTISDNDPQLIPVPTYGQYLDIFQKGGLLLTGELLLPAVLRDPVRVISSIDWQPPQNTEENPPRPYQASDFTSNPVLAFNAFGEYQTWISDIVAALTNIESYGRIQMFVPSLSELFTLGNYLEPYGADEASDGVAEQLVDPMSPNLVVITPEEEAYLDNNGNAAFDIGVDTPLRYAAPEPCYDSIVDTTGTDDCTPGDGFVDVNLNNRYDEGVDTLLDLDGTPGASEEMFVDLDGDGAYFAGGWHQDLGNGLYDDGEPFADVGNGVYDFGEAFVDNDGDGIYRSGTSDTFTDAGNGVYDGPEPFDDVNQDGVFDPATETFTDTNGNEQWDAGEAFVDTGNGVFDGANGSPERVTFVDPANVQTIVQDIIDSFYIEGYLDVDLLSVNFGKGFLRIDADGLEAEVDIPWLLGAKATAGIGFRSMSFTETLADMMDSPLVASVIDGLPIGVTAEEIRDSLLPSSGLPIPDIRVALPVGFLSGELDYDGLRAWIQTVLDVPANVIDVPDLPPAEETAFRASFAAFTPGYGDPAAGASETEVYGGMRLEAMLNLPGVVEDLDFTFEMTLPAIDPANPPPLANVASLLIPNFTATARASRIELGAGLGGVDSLVRLEGIGGQDAIVSLSKEEAGGTPTLTGTINGQLTLLDSLSLTAVGDIEADLSLTDPAVFGDIALGTGVLSPTGDYGLDADFHLQFNNDLEGDDRQILRDGQPLVIPAGLRVTADGAIDVPGWSLVGAFGLTVDPTPGAQKVEVSGTVDSIDLGPLGEYSGAADLQITAAGVAGAFAVSPGGMANPVYDLSGTFSMEVNTTTRTTLGIPASTVRLAVDDATLAFLDRDSGPAFDPQFELGPLSAAATYSSAKRRYEMSVDGDVAVWGLGEFAFSGTIASDGLFDITGDVDIDIVYPENPPTAFEFHHNASIDASRTGLFDPIAFDASFGSTSPTVFGIPVLPGTSASVTSAGCMTVAMQYESPKSIYEPTVIVTRSVSVYVDLNRPIFEQNIFSPANLDPQLCGGGDAGPLDVAMIDVASANHDDGIVFVENDPIEGDLLVRQIEAPEGDEVLLTAMGLPRGATVDVRVSLVSETLPAINTPHGGEDYQNLALGVIRLTGVDADRDGHGDPIFVTLAEILFDGQFEFHESLTLDLEIVDGSATGVDFVLLAADRLRYTIVNTTPEAAGSVTYYDFDDPLSGDYTPTPTVTADPVHFAASPLHYGPDPNFVFGRSLLFNSDNADNDYVEVQMNEPLPRDAISFEFWMRADASTTTFEHPIGLGGENQATVYVRSDTNKVVLKFQSINGLRVERTIGDYVVGQWHHVAVTYDGSQVKGYLDGELRTVGAASGLIDYLSGFEDLVYFGTFDTVTDKAFDGRLDEVRIWNRAITAAEVALNKNRALEGNEDGLIGYWPCDETTGTIVADQTGNGQDGVFGPATPVDRQPFHSGLVPPMTTPPALASGAFEGVPEIQPDTTPPEPISQTAVADTWRRIDSPWLMHLRMDETSGTTLVDFTGASHNGLLSGGTRTSGAFGGGVLLDGVDDFVRVFNTAGLPTTGDSFTVTFSLKLDDWLNTNGMVASYNANGIAFNIGPSAADDAMLVRTSFGSGSQVAYEASLAGLTNGEFAHFAISFSPTIGVSSVYINGALIPDTGGSAWLLGDESFFSLGRRFLSGGSALNLRGTIDDFGIFDGSFSTGYAESVASGGALALAVDWSAYYYEFTVALDDGGPISPDDVRLTLANLRFYDHADAGGVTEWLLKSSLDNFTKQIDSGAAHVGEFDRSLATFGPDYTCLRPSDTPITLRLYGVAVADARWRIDDLSLLGAIHDSSVCIDPPVAIDDSRSTNEDVPLDTGDVTANDIDPVGGGLTVVAFTPPAIGVLVQNGNAFTYTPPANNHDDTSFTYTARDAIGQETTGTVTITVNAVNDPPSAIGQTVSTNEDTAKAITLSGTDVETSAANLTYAIVSQPSHGTLSGSGRNWTYTPSANYNGSDSFTFRVTDRGDPDGSGTGVLASSPATVSINIAAVNDPPVLVNDTANAWSGFPRTINVLANDSDPDGDNLSVVGVTQPSGQSNAVAFSSSSVTYTPPSNFTGTAVFTYTASDGTTTRTATVTVTVAANVPPTVVVVSPVDLAQNNSQPLFLTAGLDASGSSDPDGGPQPLSYQWVQTGGPGNPIPISNANQATASAFIGNVTAPRTYQFEVTVSDGISSRVGNVTVRIYEQGTNPGPCTPPACFPGTTGAAGSPAAGAILVSAHTPNEVVAPRGGNEPRGDVAVVAHRSAAARSTDIALASLVAERDARRSTESGELRAFRDRSRGTALAFRPHVGIVRPWDAVAAALNDLEGEVFAKRRLSHRR